jgi:dienelactone hydrolase
VRCVPLLSIFLALTLSAADRRNTSCPNTDTPVTFTAPVDLKSWELRKTQLRNQILSASGLLPLPARNPLRPLIYDRITHDDYTIEKVALETLPGYWLGGNLYRPKSPAGKVPAVLYPHGHWNYGRLEHQPLYSGPTLGINLARHGFVVFAYDMVGYNDTAQTPHDFSTPAFQLWGFTPLGLQLWNSIRVIDFLESLPEVDSKRIAATGASGGGTQTFLLAAVDDRIAVSAPVNMVSGIMQGGCVCENAPGLRLGTNNIETAALAAPRPQLMVAATGDWTRNVPRQEYPAVKSVYELYGKASLVETVQFDSPHNYHQESRQAVYDFLRKHLTPDAPPFRERSVNVERLQDMLVFWNRPRPAHARTFEQIFSEWQAASRRQALAATPAELKQRLRLVIGDSSLLTLGDTIPYRYLEGQGTPVMYVHPDGIQAAESSARVKELRAAGRPVLLIDTFQTGSAKAPRDRSHKHFLTFNSSDDAARVQDILAALRWLDSKQTATPELEAEGNARLWALLAAAAADRPVLFRTRPGDFPNTDDQLAQSLFLPGLQRAGGLEAAQRILKVSAR